DVCSSDLLGVDVVVHADAGGRLEVGDRVRGHVVGPVVDVEDLVLGPGGALGGVGTGLAAPAGGEDQGTGDGGEAQGHGNLRGWWQARHVRSAGRACQREFTAGPRRCIVARFPQIRARSPLPCRGSPCVPPSRPSLPPPPCPPLPRRRTPGPGPSAAKSSPPATTCGAASPRQWRIRRSRWRPTWSTPAASTSAASPRTWTSAIPTTASTPS